MKFVSHADCFCVSLNGIDPQPECFCAKRLASSLSKLRKQNNCSTEPALHAVGKTCRSRVRAEPGVSRFKFLCKHTGNEIISRRQILSFAFCAFADSHNGCARADHPGNAPERGCHGGGLVAVRARPAVERGRRCAGADACAARRCDGSDAAPGQLILLSQTCESVRIACVCVCVCVQLCTCVTNLQCFILTAL